MRPRGPLAGDTTARVLHVLLVGLMLWFALYITIILPFFNVRKAVSELLAILGMFAWFVALILLRRGFFRRAAILYLSVLFLSASLLLVLYGGVRSAAIVLYMALPISAAWLLGRRAALISAAACLVNSFVLALLEATGVAIPRYFPGTPFGIWALFLLATIVSAAPVVLILRILQEALAESHTLAARLLMLQDEERRRLATDLHESTAQTLAALGMTLGSLRQEAAKTLSPEARRLLSDSVELADQCIKEIRTFAYLLHPPSLEQLGLESALSSYVDGFVRRSGIPVNIVIPPDLERLPASVERAIFSIVQESLTNVYRHSGSKVARIRLTRAAGELVVEVVDEGHGLPPDLSKPPGVGIAGMKERLRELGGRLELVRSQPHGTIVRAILPVH